jgi:hypothetical protein
MTAVRTERYKLVAYHEIRDFDELYDLQNDPHELRNLARDPAHAALHAEMTARLEKARVANDWSAEAFPRNLPRVKGRSGTLLDLSVTSGTLTDAARSGLTIDLAKAQVREGTVHFDGRQNALRLPFDPLIDPAGWPFRIRLQVNPETDGVLVTQTVENYGFKLFVQDGRPGLAVNCRSWIDTTTVIDGPESVIGKWTELEALIDFNRIALVVDGRLVETVSLPLPFKGSPRGPLIIGNTGAHPVAAGVPDHAFAGSIRRFTLSRRLSGP